MKEQLRNAFRSHQLNSWFARIRGASPRLQRSAYLVVTIAVIVSIVGIAAMPSVTSASYVNVLANGGFEQGFSSQPGCGMVGSGWNCFTNGGAANYGFYDDQWEPVVAEGAHSQLLEVNTKEMPAGDPDRFSGIFQTVRVVDWAEYSLSLQGMIRTTNLEGDQWRYRVEVGWTAGPQPNWLAVKNWTDVGWDNYYERTNPGSMSSFATKFMAEDDYITVYVRVWKKWGVPYEEIDVNLDNIALVGPHPDYGFYPPQVVTPLPVQPVQPVVIPTTLPGVLPTVPVYPVTPVYPVPPVADVCYGTELVYNGGFEWGFNPVAVGHVGSSWGFFTNGGAANYGFYDDQFPPVVAEGKHAQLIEINTKGIFPADADRYAGIFQYISGLQPGATYEFSMKGLLRGEGNEDDPYRFSAQWGSSAGYSHDWKAVSNWQEMDLGPIQSRTAPTSIGSYKVRFVAPASDMTLFIRGWKKWGITNVEMDFNIDAVSVRSCGPVVTPPVTPDCWSPCVPVPPIAPECWSPCVPVVPPVVPDCWSPCAPPTGCGVTCNYIVQPGDTLSGIAVWLGVNYHELVAINGIVNPNFIFVGQILVVPGCGGACSPGPIVPLPEPLPPAAGNTYVVQPGDTLSQIAKWYGVSVQALINVNGIWDPNHIFVGQVLIIP